MSETISIQIIYWDSIENSLTRLVIPVDDLVAMVPQSGGETAILYCNGHPPCSVGMRYECLQDLIPTREIWSGEGRKQNE